MNYILGAYSQLPLGCDERLLEEILAKILKPLLTDIYSKPEMKLLLHLSVNEYEWLEQKYPEINMLIYDLCKKNQLELLAGSYYDVMLPLIPAHERSLQIEKSTTYIRKRFGKKPRGMWCNQQFFSPTLIPVLSMSSLEYLVISSFNQSQNTIIATKPFYMDEMGRETLIFPSDDRFSREISEVSSFGDNDQKLISSLQKIASSTKDSLVTLTLNLDQLVFAKDPLKVIQALQSSLGTKSILPSQYLVDNQISRNGYLPAGLYGRDLNLGKTPSLNQRIIETPLANKYYREISLLRELTKDLKKNSVLRTKIETLMAKCNSSSLFCDEYMIWPNLRAFINKSLCEIEDSLNQAEVLPSQMDLDGDRHPEWLACSKNNIAFINSKGAVISRFSVTSCFWDLVNHNGEGLFADNLINTITGKKISLASKRFDITPIDKKRNDFFASTNSIELDFGQVNVIKRFKFRQNSVIVEIDVENIGTNSIEGFVYESTLNLFLNEHCSLTGAQEEGTQTYSLSDKTLPITINFGFSDSLTVETKHVYQNFSDCLGDRQFYQYTQLTIKKKLSLKPIQEDHLSLAMRIEKRKEKK